MSFQSLYDKFTGPCIRRIHSKELTIKSLFLTFDDGPHDVLTKKVLELLKKYQSRATFFVIGNHVKDNLDIAKLIIEEGHAIGNHTIDHDTNNYFKNKSHLKAWVQTSEDFLKEQLACEVVGFRSPLGMKTPPLMRALKEDQLPLILWDTRFYDTNNELTKTKMDTALAKLQNGSIILLHDTLESSKQENFLIQLEYFITCAKEEGYNFLPLTKAMVTNTFQEKYGLKK
ncbi:hypothetical protein A9Q84_01175 [Halobacteriovorax marinus]|uniref:NodB homology domain-containing protein n=1 Tax=Halobacteriovorax marinus TaxID=97084 RepID=A0A1Y5FHK2_9BACT|nr:hypothetical protein A9Q84_01175 [Halobacteriovorax marinus]